MSKHSLYMTIGSSHSGKSTYAKTWERQLSNVPRLVIETDDIRRAMTGERYCRDAETVVFAHKHIMIKTFIHKKEILVVGTHTSRESLKRILEINENVIPIVFDTPLDECIRRTSLTGQPHMIPVIERHYRQLQELLSYGLERTLDEIRNELEYRWQK